MPYIFGPSTHPGSSVSKDFEPEIDGLLLARLQSDDTLSHEELETVPRVLRIGRLGRKRELPAFLGWNFGPLIVSARPRELLEELDPGRLEYIPMTVRSDREFDGRTEHGTYFLIVPPPCLDAVVVEETAFRRGFGRAGFMASAGWLSSEPGSPCVLDGQKIGGRHLWRLSDAFNTEYVCSDEFWRRVKQENLKGWTAKKTCTVRPT